MKAEEKKKGRDADFIYVMEQGHIIEQGAHEELVTRQGVYAAMWEVQAGRYTPAAE